MLHRHHDQRDARECGLGALEQLQAGALRVVEVEQQQLGVEAFYLGLERTSCRWTNYVKGPAELVGQFRLPDGYRQVNPHQPRILLSLGHPYPVRLKGRRLPPTYTDQTIKKGSQKPAPSTSTHVSKTRRFIDQSFCPIAPHEAPINASARLKRQELARKS